MPIDADDSGENWNGWAFRGPSGENGACKKCQLPKKDKMIIYRRDGQPVTFYECASCRFKSMNP